MNGKLLLTRTKSTLIIISRRRKLYDCFEVKVVLISFPDVDESVRAGVRGKSVRSSAQERSVCFISNSKVN